MDKEELIKKIRELVVEKFQWKFILYSAKKSKGDTELLFSSCKMQNIHFAVNAILLALLEKPLAEKSVTEYTPFLPKESIGALDAADDTIQEQLNYVLTEVQHVIDYAPEDYLSGVVPAPNGYGFYGCLTDEEGKITDQILLLNRKNPFVIGKRSLLCSTQADEITAFDKPVLNISYDIGFLYFDKICYFINPNIERDFGLENRNILICERKMKLIAETPIVNNYEQLEAVAMKNARKFIDFDKELLERILKMPVVDREEFLSTYGILIDKEGLMDTNDKEQCELVIDLLCGRSCLDVFGRLAVGNNITPR